MRINSVAATNFKGRSFSHQIAPVTVITGDNFAGKTAIEDAVRVGLIGYLPRIGKQASATWKLAGTGPEMTVNLGIDLGTAQTEISHRWKPKKDGGASYEGAIPWETPPTLLDAREYLTQPVADRMGTVFRLCDPEKLGYSDGRLLELVAAVEVLPTKVSKPMVDGILGEIAHSMGGRKDKPVQIWLEEFIDSLDGRLKVARANARGLGAQVTGLKPGPATVVARDVSTELAAARTQRDEIAGQMRAIEDGEKAGMAAVQRRREIESELAGSTSPAVEIQKLEEELKTLPKGGKAADAKLAVSQWRQQITQLEEQRAKAVVALAGLQERDPDKLSACPHCGAAGQGWAAGLAVKHRAEVDAGERVIVALDGQLAGLRKELNAAKAAFTTTSAHEETTDARREAVQSQLLDLRTTQRTRDKLMAELAGLNTSAAAPTANLAELTRQHAGLVDKVAHLEEMNTAWQVQAEQKRKRDEIETGAVKTTVEVDVLKEIIKTLRTMLGQMVEVAFNELLIKARLFTDGIMLSPLIYWAGDLGRMEGERFVSWETFSGLEETLAFAALSIALCQSAPIKVVLMDELGRLTPDNKGKLIRRMVELAGNGTIDNFIGIDVTPAPYRVDGVQLIQL